MGEVPTIKRGVTKEILSIIAVCLQMHANCSVSQQPGNGGNLAEHDQKLFSPGESHMTRKEFINEILSPKSGLSGNARLLLDKSKANRVAVPHSVTKSLGSLP